MLKFILNKLLHKKWIFLCLLLGNILLIAIASSNAMYKNASLQSMLTDDFKQSLQKTNLYPTVLTLNGNMIKNVGKDTYQDLNRISQTIASDIGIPELERVHYQHIIQTKAYSLRKSQNKNFSQEVKVSNLSNLESNITIISGNLFQDEMLEDGCIDVIVSQSAYFHLNLLIGEKYEFDIVTDTKKNPLRVRVAGVFEANQNNDFYWINSPNSYTNDFFVSDKAFSNYILNYNDQVQIMKGYWYVLFDYSKIKVSQIDDMIEKTTNYTKEYNSPNATIKTPKYITILNQFKLNQKKVMTTLLILQIPMLVLLCSFLFMISKQMLDMEKNEIALLKSRGSGKSQLIAIYLLQSIFITFVSILIGLPIGILLCKALGSTIAFLEFAQRRSFHIDINSEVLLSCFLSAILSILVMVLPVFKYANFSIVLFKQNKNKKILSLWRKLYLDLFIVGIALYSYYNYKEHKEALMVKVLSGTPLDPLLYLSSSLFMLGASFIVIRIQPLIVKFIFYLRKKHWKPASYASFLQIIRTGKNQSFIMVFLILTIALGIFNSTMARSILTNANNNIIYRTGTDVRLQENWIHSYLSPSNQEIVEIIEPDFKKYMSLKEVEAITKVTLYNKNFIAQTAKGDIPSSIMAIQAYEFGNTKIFQDELLPFHINYYLNTLAKNPNAVILSKNFKTKYGIQLGDQISFGNDTYPAKKSIVCGFIDYWPSYELKTTVYNSDGSVETKDNYLILANSNDLMKEWTIPPYPYQVWINFKDTTKPIYDFINEKKLNLTFFEDTKAQLFDLKNSTLFQGTNGVLTMSFIIVLLLSCIGFLIYWILNIRSRELLFGVLRAMGLSKKELNHMLIIEQIFSTGLALMFGIIIGIIATKLYVPLIQIAYLSTDQFIPFKLITNQIDIYRVFAVITIMILICMVILRFIIAKMNITQALKLGED